MNCAAPTADWTVISNCAELTLIPAWLFLVSFWCPGIKVNSAQLEITV